MRLIDADMLKEEIKSRFGYSSATAYLRNMQKLTPIQVFKHIMKLIEIAPTVDKGYNEGHIDGMLKAEKLYARPIGEWKLDDTEQFCYCSNCEDTYYPRPLDPTWNYCPHCGAEMKGADK